MSRIEINLDAKCKRCGGKGATQNGICLSCITLALQRGEYDHIIDKHKHVQDPTDESR